MLSRCRFCENEFDKNALPGGFNNHVRNCRSNPKVKARKGTRKLPSSSGSAAEGAASPRPISTPTRRDRRATSPRPATSAPPTRRSSYASTESRAPPAPTKRAAPDVQSMRLAAASALSALSDEPVESVLQTPSGRVYRRYTVIVYEDDGEVGVRK